MPKTKITVRVQQTSIGNDSGYVLLHPSYIKQWKIPTDLPITFKFGSFQTAVKVTGASHIKGMRISESLAEKTGLQNGEPIHIRYITGSQTIVVGPLVGVMVGRIHDPAKPFGTNTAFCHELTEAGKSRGALVYIFSPHDVSANFQSVAGWVFNGRWTKMTFPVPDVVYNRLTHRKYENRASVQRLFKEMKLRHHTEMFNEKYLNKAEVFEALKNDHSLHRYLPESHLLKNYQMLKTMCGKYPVVFLKPVTGSYGIGIIRVNRHRGNTYTGHFTHMNGTRKQNFPSIAKLFSAISGKLKARKYQIQQGIPLISAGGRPVDFRALVQKKARHEWSLTSIVARIAGNDHFVSNIARGGSLCTVKDALVKTDLPSKQWQETEARLKRAALEIAQGIEEHIEGHFAELGIDLAVDTSGKVWLLEVNSKPSKTDQSSLTARKIRPSATKVIQYSIHLCEF